MSTSGAEANRNIDSYRIMEIFNYSVFIARRREDEKKETKQKESISCECRSRCISSKGKGLMVDFNILSWSLLDSCIVLQLHQSTYNTYDFLSSNQTGTITNIDHNTLREKARSHRFIFRDTKMKYLIWLWNLWIWAHTCTVHYIYPPPAPAGHRYAYS